MWDCGDEGMLKRQEKKAERTKFTESEFIRVLIKEAIEKRESENWQEETKEW